MNQTPSVPDKLAEIKKLNEEIVKFKFQKDQAQKDANDAMENVADLQSRRASLELQLASPESGIVEVVDYSQKVLNECILAIRTASSEVDGYLQLVKSLSDKVKEQTVELERIAELKKQAHENILAEEVALATKQKDLDIYAKRLQQKIDTYKLTDEVKLD